MGKIQGNMRVYDGVMKLLHKTELQMKNGSVPRSGRGGQAFESRYPYKMSFNAKQKPVNCMICRPLYLGEIGRFVK